MPLDFIKMKKQKIYVFGNPLLDFDNLPIKLVPKLRKLFPEIDFVVQDPNENLKPEKGEMYIIDTIMDSPESLVLSPEHGAKSLEPKDVIVFEDLDKIHLDKIYSAHDFDLGFNLKLLQKIGWLKKVVIFGVPEGMSEYKALKQLAREIDNLKF